MIIGLPTGIKIFVRYMRFICYWYWISNDFYNVIASTRLGEKENFLLNIASLIKAIYEFKWFIVHQLQDVLSMVNARLRKVKSLVLSLDKGQLDHNGLYRIRLIMKICIDRVDILARFLIKIIKKMSLQPKESNLTNIITIGWPKEGNFYGHRVRVVPVSVTLEYSIGNTIQKGRLAAKTLSNKRFYSTESTKDVISKFDNLVDRCRLHPNLVIDRSIYSLICDPRLLELAYNNIKSKPGNMTPGVIPETLDGISSEYLVELSKSLKNESFKFKPGRKVHIEKSTGGTRILTIAPPRDKIVQESIRMILSAIYEPVFLNTSHGFRPKRSCHTALKYVYLKFKPVCWVIEGDIAKCFDTIDHTKLMNLIENKILDRQFTKLIWKSLRAGYFEFKNIQHNIIGTPQGSIISPILSNIFMHQLDVFIASLSTEFNIGTRAKNTSKYEKIRYLIKKTKKNSDIENLTKLYKTSQKIPVMDFSYSGYKRLIYVRYADDWIIGIRGSIADTKEILLKVTNFCTEIGLTISESKTKITNINTDKVVFLGVNIFRAKHIKYSRKSSSAKQRQNLQLRMTASLDRIRSKLTMSNFIKYGKPYPRFLWYSLSHDQIIYLYNAVFRGFTNYYSFVHNYGQMVGMLNIILIRSCAKLLAAKFKLKSTAKVFAKFGNKLKGSKTEFITPDYKTNNMRFKIDSSPIVENLYASHKSLASLNKMSCSVCGSDYRVEMHHIKYMKDLNRKVSQVDRIMIKAQRKQIPLCRVCHMKKHNKTL